MNTTVAIVKKHLITPIQMPQVDLARAQRLAEVTGRREYLEPIREQTRLVQENKRQVSLANEGFNLEVSRELVSRMKYAAAVSWPTWSIKWAWKYSEVQQKADDCPVVGIGNRWSKIVYVGDMPDFAIDRLLAAKEAGIQYFTVHSMEPLPIKEVMRRVDPVLLGWERNPVIGRLDSDRPWEVLSMNAPRSAIVIAMWDMDKELSLFER